MILDLVYLLFASLNLLATLTALFRGRALGWLVPPWFLLSLFATELVVVRLSLRLLVLLIALVLMGNSVFVSLGHVVFVIAILGDLAVLRRHFESGKTFERALRTGLELDFEGRIPAPDSSLETSIRNLLDLGSKVPS